MRIFSYIIWILLIIIGASFAILNSQSLSLNYFIGKTTIYFPLLFLLLLLCGAILGFFAALPFIMRSKARNHRLKQKMKALEQEVANLRTMPIKDSH